MAPEQRRRLRFSVPPNATLRWLMALSRTSTVFSGDLSGNFGGIHFTSTLNDAGTHAGGTYTLTPGANGNCLGIALTGTFTGDEVPSVSGNWTGTVTCSVELSDWIQ